MRLGRDGTILRIVAVEAVGVESGPLVAVESADGFSFLDDGRRLNGAGRRAVAIEHGVF